MLFSTYGTILDIVALKTMKMRGQAHVVFRDIQAATQAMRSLDGETFLGRTMKVQYAKSKSDYVAKLDGTFKIPTKSTGAANVEQTELQQSIFNAPPAGGAAASSTGPKPPADQPMQDAGSPAGRGQKRTRDSDAESDEDVAMDEDSDDE